MASATGSSTRSRGILWRRGSWRFQTDGVGPSTCIRAGESTRPGGGPFSCSAGSLQPWPGDRRGISYRARLIVRVPSRGQLACPFAGSQRGCRTYRLEVRAMTLLSCLQRASGGSTLAGRGRSARQGRARPRPARRRRQRPGLERLEARAVPASFPTPLLPVAPSGGLIDQGSLDGAIAAPAETDTYTLTLDGDQTVALVAHPSAPGLRPTVTLSGPDHTVLATATAVALGADAVLQALPIHQPGTYTFSVSGESSSTGAYTLEVI